MNIESFIQPNFGFTIWLKNNPPSGQIRRAIRTLNQGNISEAWRHERRKDGSRAPHIHNMLWLPEDARVEFLTTLFERFEPHIKRGLFKPLKDNDIQSHIRKPREFVAYAKDEENKHPHKEVSCVWMFKGNTRLAYRDLSQSKRLPALNALLAPAPAVRQRQNEVLALLPATERSSKADAQL